MPGWAWVVLGLAALFGLHRVAVWMEGRGWIYWTRSGGHSTRAGNALLELQEMLEPSKRHVIEMKRDLKAERDEAGEPPERDDQGMK